ncbi:HpcH/HpaI aldolase family protein [Dermacoccaceae bacterium W4C1]
MSRAADFAAAVRDRDVVAGYWVMTDSPVTTERIARTGYDYVCIDAQHGMLGYTGMLAGITAVDAADRGVALVRTESANAAAIGKALDAGAAGVIVPLINNADEALAAVRAARYPGEGIRSYGPMRSSVRIGPTPAEANRSVVVLAMIETPEGLANVEQIAATPGLDGLYIGPSDLTLSVGGATSTDSSVAQTFEAAVARILAAAQAAGISAGFHTPSGEVAVRRMEQGFNFLTIASDIVHLEKIAADHLGTVREHQSTTAPPDGR